VKPVIGFITSTLIGGLLVVLPVGLVAIVVTKVVDVLRHALTPITEHLSSHRHFPTAIAALLLVVACFAAGLVARTRAGRSAGSLFERTLLNHIPGYSMLRSFARRLGDVEDSERFAPAMAEIEDALVPAFLVEDHADGRSTVFVPSAPTPTMGQIYIMANERIHLLDAPFLKTAKCVSRWGVGAAELLKSMRVARLGNSHPNGSNVDAHSTRTGASQQTKNETSRGA
jgi:uncharacterized membrane protein